MELGIAVSGAHPVSVPSESHVTTTPHIEESESFHSTSHSVPIHHSAANHIAVTHSAAASTHVAHSNGDNSDNDSSYLIGPVCFLIFITLLVAGLVAWLYKVIKM
jgi:hypothetical protein